MSQNLESPETNGGSQLIPPPSPRTYMFDAPELKCRIDWSEARNTVMELTYTKPEPQDHIDYEVAVKQTARIMQGEAFDETDPEPANETYFDKLVVSAEQKHKLTGEVVRAYDRETCRRFDTKVKTRFVVAMGASDFDLVVDEDDVDAGLFALESGVKVRQVFRDGQFDDIIYALAPMEKLEAKDFASAWKTGEKAVGRQEALRTRKAGGVKKGMKYFPRKIQGIEGGLIAAGPFSQATSAEYIKQVDASFQMLVIDAVCAAGGKAPK